MPTTTLTLDQLAERVGQELGISQPPTIDQAAIDTVARVTDDEQWIHVDPVRAATGRSARRSCTGT